MSILRAFEWDPDKNAANIAKHRIDFEDAIQISEGPVLEITDERRHYREVRIVAFGVVEDRELAVVHTMRGGHRRIISARRAPAVSAKRIVRRTLKSRHRGKTDWGRSTP